MICLYLYYINVLLVYVIDIFLKTLWWFYGSQERYHPLNKNTIPTPFLWLKVPRFCRVNLRSCNLRSKRRYIFRKHFLSLPFARSRLVMTLHECNVPIRVNTFNCPVAKKKWNQKKKYSKSYLLKHIVSVRDLCAFLKKSESHLQVLEVFFT